MSRASSNSKPGVAVLIVHPDAVVRSALAHALHGEGWSVVPAGSAIEAYSAMQEGVFAAAFIHSEIADQPGTVLAEYLQRNFDMKVIMLSDEPAKRGEVSGSSIAVDGSVVQGTEYDSILREANRLMEPGETAPLERPVRKWRLFSQDWRIVSPLGESVNLTIREFQFMLRLATSKEIAVSRSDLFQCLRYRDDKHGNRALESLVHRLRKKTFASGKPLIQTAHGYGYSFSSPVEVV